MNDILHVHVGENGTTVGTLKAGVRPLHVIAAEIRRDWRTVYFVAVPYLEAMRSLSSLSDSYGEDSAESVVVYFLANANSWRGETARRVKAELKAMLKSAR